MEEDERNLVSPIASRSMSERRDTTCDVAFRPSNYVTASIEAASNEMLDVSSLPSELNVDLQTKRWDLNYHEAAIYLQEGENNDKFYAHPSSQSALPAYIITHNVWFYIFEFASAFILMLLILVEEPSVHYLHIPLSAHCSVELLCLVILGIELGLRCLWLGPKNFVRHVRSMIKAGTLLVMAIEVFVILGRQVPHYRFTRALRPLILLDSYYLRGIRRFIRQMVQSMPPILDMLLLLMFFMLIFSVLGFYLFTNIEEDKYFNTLEVSFVSLFVLLTTANYPDVMMPAYNANRWSCLFFICYLSVELYFIMSLLLAVVYDSFSRYEKIKLKKLWLHKREACRLAFKLLVTREKPDKISLRHFAGMLKFFQRWMSRRDVYLTFKALNTNKTGYLTLEEFYHLYEMIGLKWTSKSDVGWSTYFYFPLNKICEGIRWLVTLKWFEYFMYLVILMNSAWIFADAIRLSLTAPDVRPELNDIDLSWYSLLFLAIYMAECCLKIIGLGPSKYFRSGWNVFDFVLSAIAFFGIFAEINHPSYVVVLRPIRLLRLFRAKKRLRDVLGTLFILLNRLVSLGIVIILLYYVFAVVGMEFFYQYDMRNCCKNTTVESNYFYENGSSKNGFYYLNNFHDALQSGVTLFELTVVNNWYIIMEGYAQVSSRWARIYFMIFYIITMVVMNVVVAFILEAFLFRMQYKEKMHIENMDDDAFIKYDVALCKEELQMCIHKSLPLHNGYLTGRLKPLYSPTPTSRNTHPRQINSESDVNVQGSVNHAGDVISSYDMSVIHFRGERRRGKEDYSLKMLKNEVEEWIHEERQRPPSTNQEEELQELPENVQYEDQVQPMA